MTNQPDCVWLVVGEDGLIDRTHTVKANADADKRWCSEHGVKLSVLEYRLHRPINWRTGAPDAETVARCGNSFAVLIPNGTVLRFAERKHQHWYWHSTPAFRGGALSLHNAVSGWCPEDEMPKEAT